MGINKFGSQKSIAWDFSKWFTSEKTSIAFSQAGGFPPRNAVLNNAEHAKHYTWHSTLKEVVPTAFADCRPRISQSFDISIS